MTGEPDKSYHPDITNMPLSIHLVGQGTTPTIFSVLDRKPDGSEWSFTGMTLVERAALRALLQEAIAMIDRSEP